MSSSVRNLSFRQHPKQQSNMKLLVVTLALVGAASAGYIGPIATGYSGLGWGNAAIAGPAVTTYSASVVTPVVRNVISAAPAVATYNTYSAPIVSATPITPIVRNVVAAAPAYTSYAATPIVTSYAAAAPAITTWSAAPSISTYAAGPIISDYGHSTIYDSGFGADSWSVDLWKKKKAAKH